MDYLHEVNVWIVLASLYLKIIAILAIPCIFHFIIFVHFSSNTIAQNPRGLMIGGV